MEVLLPESFEFLGTGWVILHILARFLLLPQQQLQILQPRLVILLQFIF